MRAGDSHGLVLGTAELHEQSVLAAAAKVLSVLAHVSALGRGGNLAPFHPAITANTAPHRKAEASRCDSNGFSKPHSDTRACCAVSPIERQTLGFISHFWPSTNTPNTEPALARL